MAEKEKLLKADSSDQSYGSVDKAPHDEEKSLLSSSDTSTHSTHDIRLKRHITLPYAVAIMVGNVIGSGIFVSPKGVTQNIGSVGASLIVWGGTGVYNLAQALCYAELGAIIPMAGGDYAYIYEILGPLPAFMCAWIHILVIASCSCAVIARTAGLYLIEPLGLDCRLDIITLLAIFIIVTLATINALSSVWGTRVQTLFTVSKVAALIIVIIAGIVKMAQGYTSNFNKPFENTSTDPGLIALSILDGYFAYKGWELINALHEEMVNPERDLHLTVWISMTLVTVIYVLTNMAYFSVLTPQELIESDAVALTFAERALGSAQIIIPIAVALSCMGAVNGDFLSNSRYLFAGGRYRQMPVVLSYLHIHLKTPILAVLVLCVCAVIYCVFTDLQQLQEYASLVVQLKMLLCLVALFYLRYKAPNIRRPVRVNTIVAVLTMLIMVALVALSFYKSPMYTGIGVGIFLLGMPVYFLIVFCRDRKTTNIVMDKITVFLQRLVLVVPETFPTKSLKKSM